VSTLKRTMKRVLRPLLHPILHRIDEVRHMAVRLDRHLPLVTNAIESQNAELRAAARHRAEVRAELDRLRDDLQRTQQQVEALHGEFALALSAGAQVEARVVLSTRAAVSRRPVDDSGELRLSFGWGAQTMSEHMTIDLQELGGGDLAAGLRGLSFGECSAAEVRASLVLERFSLAELREVVLPYWHALLRPGGDLVAVGIDAEANLSDYQAGRISFEELATVSLDADRNPTAPRRCMLSEGRVVELLERAGFESVETAARWREGAANLIEVRARRAGQVEMQVEVGSRNDVHA
jgi:hypothetical protein